MSAIGKTMYEMSCDHPNLCSEELESYDGGAWLYNTADEARAAAVDYDWVHVGGKDYCPRHVPDVLAADVENTKEGTRD